MRMENCSKVVEITIIHGQGSVIHARPAENNYAEVGDWFRSKI